MNNYQQWINDQNVDPELVNSTTFTVTKINDIINVRILSYGTVLAISISIMIVLIVFDINFIIETSKHTKEMMQQEEIQLKTEAHFQNFQSNNNHDNIDTIDYNVNTIDSRKQINSIIILFYVFRYDIVNDGVEKENEVAFKKKKKSRLW